MDSASLNNFESTPGVESSTIGATVAATQVLSEEPATASPVAPLGPGSANPSGWALVVAAAAIALVVMLILGLGFGIGYLLDVRNGIDPLGAAPSSTECVTTT